MMRIEDLGNIISYLTHIHDKAVRIVNDDPHIEDCYVSLNLGLSVYGRSKLDLEHSREISIEAKDIILAQTHPVKFSVNKEDRVRTASVSGYISLSARQCDIEINNPIPPTY